MEFRLWLFALGLAVGSFLNVLLLRFPKGISVIFPASHCPKCSHKLAWRDNVPLVSYVILYGRCRFCKGAISIQYPLVELGTGVLFSLAAVPLEMVLFW